METRNFTSEAKIRIGIDLQEFGIENGKPIPLDKLAELVRANEPALVDGIKRHFYWQLKLALFNKPFQYPSGDNWSVVGKRYKREKELYQARAILFLGKKFENIRNAQFDQRFKQPRLEFLFSGDEETAINEVKYHDEFNSLDAFKYEGSLIGARTKGTEPGEPEELFDLKSSSPENYQKLRLLSADYQETAAWLVELQKPENRFEVPSQAIIELVKKFKLNPTKSKNLVFALGDFGNYMYRLEGGRSTIGDCLVIPNHFANFCRHKYAINLDVPHYGERGDGDGGASGYEPYSFFHEVNVFEKKIVIDWTVSQFKDYANAPFPYVYSVGDSTKFYGGQLYKGAGERSKDNDPYSE